MKLYLIRHAPAQLRHTFAKTGLPDFDRPLTERGREKMIEILDQFQDLEPQIDLFLQSPLTRAQQTGDIFKSYYPDAQFRTTDSLCPNHNAETLFNEILSFEVESLALIGHEPDLGQFLSWLLFGQSSDQFPIKKGGIAKIDIYRDGRRYLKWLIRPKMLTRQY